VPEPQPYLPTQAAEFSGPGKAAIVLYCPDWTEPLLALLASRPTSYEAAWRYAQEERAHVLELCYEGAEPLQIGLVDGTHNAVIASLARGRALVLSPYPLYREGESSGPGLFDPAVSLLLPELPAI